MNTLKPTEYAGLQISTLKRHGITAEEKHNTFEILQRTEALRGDPISRPASVHYHDFTHENSYWLIFQKSGQDIACVAAKIMDIGKEDTAQFLSRTLTRQFFGYGEKRIECKDLREVQQMQGKLVYMSELFIAEEQRGSKEVLRSIMRLHFTTALLKWQNLDWIYSFLRNKDTGKAEFYGFTGSIPSPLLWPEERDGRSDQERLAFLSSASLQYSIEAWHKLEKI